MRLLSYNIHKGIGGRDRKYRLERVIEVIAHEAPDFVCLQEVDRNVARSRHDDQPAILAAALGLSESIYQLNFRVRSGGYGNLLLSRWPIVERHQIPLRFRAQKPRGAQMAVIESPQGPLHLVHSHLGLAERTRRWQADHLLSHPLYRASAHLPTLVVGDFNDWRNALVKAIFQPRRLAQVTAPPSRFRSFPAYLAVGSLDKAFACDQVCVEHARVVRTRLAKVASDHLPLVIDFHLQRTPA